MDKRMNATTWKIICCLILITMFFAPLGVPSNVKAASEVQADRSITDSSKPNFDTPPPSEDTQDLDWTTFLEMAGGGQGEVQALEGNPSLTWNTFFGSSGFDSGFNVALDSSANVYIVGRSDDKWGVPINNPAGGGDTFVAKLNTSGNLQWLTFLGGTASDMGFSITVDGSGNVFIAGRSAATWGTPVNSYAGGSDTFIAKLNSSGILQWNTFLGSAGYDNQLDGLEVDGSGNIFVAGYSDSTWGTPVNAHAGGQDAFVAKLNSSGALQWNTFLGSAGEEFGIGLALDSTGNLFVGGNSSATWGSPLNTFAGDYDAFIAQLDSSGALQWNTFLGSSGYDWGGGIVLDGSGNIYAAGESDSTWGSPVASFGGGTWDVYAVKLNSSGVLQWNTFMGGAGDDVTLNGDSISLDSFGNVYVTGESSATWGTPLGSFAGTNTTNAFAAKLNTNGVRQWNRFLGESSGGVAVAADGSGNSHIVGSSWSDWDSTPVNPFTAGQEAFVVKLDSNGAWQWNTFLGARGFDGGFGITTDSSGNVYITGYSYATWGTPLNAHTGGYGADIFVAMLNSSGVLQWHTFLGSSSHDYSSAIALDGSGNIYLTGYSYDTWGSPVNAYSGTADIVVAKLNNSGVLQWNTFLGSDYGWEAGWDLALDGSNNIYITGEGDDNWGSPVNSYSGGGGDILVAKLNNNGALQWHTFQGSEYSDWGDYLEIDGNGNVFISGTSDYTWGSPINAWAGYYDAFVAKLNNSGIVQWNTFLGTNQDDDYAGGLALDGIGNVYVGGDSAASWGNPLNAFSGPFDGFVTKLNSSGARQWNTFLGGAGDDSIYDLDLDVEGNIYITGMSSASWGTPANAYSGDYDAIVAKLNSNGIFEWNTFLGTVGYDMAFGLTVRNSSLYVIGYNWDEWGAPINPYSGSADVFVAKLNIYTSIFADAPTGYWAKNYIERLYNAGITGGCSTTPLSYCPEDQVSRAQMAVFLERGIRGSSYGPPAVGASTGFSDVPTSYWAAAWIKQLAADNITSGCGPDTYCPEDPVTRAQMAVFLLRSKYGSSYGPPAVGLSTGFDSDVPTNHWAAPWIKQLAAEGITSGCGPNLYCPDYPVTRAQMAVFLVRTFSLP